MCDNMLIYRGEKFSIDAPVRNFQATGLKALDVPQRTEKARWVVLHWTASERLGDGGAQKIFNSLTLRGLSVEFFVDNAGVIYQFVDPGFDHARHAGYVNASSVGIEVSCYGFGKRTPKLGALRDHYIAQIQGRRVRIANYYLSQQHSVNVLCQSLANLMGIPRNVLEDPYEVRSRSEIKNGAGFMGHMHCSSRKYDPGPGPLEALAEFFEEGS